MLGLAYLRSRVAALRRRTQGRACRGRAAAVQPAALTAAMRRQSLQVGRVRSARCAGAPSLAGNYWRTSVTIIWPGDWREGCDNTGVKTYQEQFAHPHIAEEQLPPQAASDDRVWPTWVNRSNVSAAQARKATHLTEAIVMPVGSAADAHGSAHDSAHAERSGSAFNKAGSTCRRRAERRPPCAVAACRGAARSGNAAATHQRHAHLGDTLDSTWVLIDD